MLARMLDKGVKGYRSMEYAAAAGPDICTTNRDRYVIEYDQETANAGRRFLLTHGKLAHMPSRKQSSRTAKAALKRKRAPGVVPKKEIEALVEEAIVDAYGESQQSTGFFTMFEEHLALPFETKVLGVAR